MDAPIHCEVFRITWPDWSTVTDARKVSIWQVMNQGIEDGLPPNRRSFVGINRLGDVITGFFAHEDRRIGVQYDSHWTKQERSDSSTCTTSTRNPISRS